MYYVLCPMRLCAMHCALCTIYIILHSLYTVHDNMYVHYPHLGARWKTPSIMFDTRSVSASKNLFRRPAGYLLSPSPSRSAI
ncbi:hypothetical protein B484DRAFT_453685 [Ochromonadaceae sp. CCMP2298]|nr:hypothetical protein B484DRAFT_453685 [Ochromonadaceae sp. CCMP2298]